MFTFNMLAFNYILYPRSNIETQFKSFGQDARKNFFLNIKYNKYLS